MIYRRLRKFPLSLNPRKTPYHNFLFIKTPTGLQPNRTKEGMTKQRVAIATFERLPDLIADDQLFLREVAQSGLTVEPTVWSDTSVDWSTFSSVVIRSCWDYHHRHEAFLEWLARVADLGLSIWNRPNVIRWNIDKIYLRDLQEKGFRVPPTIWVEKGGSIDLRDALRSHRWRRAVVKPRVSASGHRTLLVGDGSVEQEQLDLIFRESGGLIQQFLGEVETEGEWSLLFFNKKYSHAVLKRPKSGEFRIQIEHGGTFDLATPPRGYIEVAQRIVDSIEEPLLFARVDGIPVAVLILGFGIGTNTAIFSLVQAVILKPLPYPDPTSLIQIFLTYQGNEDSIDYPDYSDITGAQHSFKNMAAVASGSLDLTGEGNPERLKVDFITSSMFAVTGSPFVLGRPFTENEDVPGGPAVVVLSEQFWRNRFNADPSIIGKNLMLSDHTFQVIGVVPRQINWWSPCDLYVPINTFELFYPGDLRNRTEHIAACFGRLNAGVSVAQAKAELDTIHERLIAQYPDTDKGYGLSVVTPGRGDYTVYDYAPAIWLLAAGVSCLLLISCANIANLLLARSLHRRNEISVRAMLGAGRWRLAGQLLLETIFLAMLGAGLGLLVAFITIEAIKKLSWQSLYRVQYRLQEVGLDIHALIFIVLVTLLVALLAGVLPALSLSKNDAGAGSKDDRNRTGTGGKQRHRAQATLVIGQVASACVLLISASLLARSFLATQNLPLGFDPNNTLSVELVLKAGMRLRRSMPRNE